MSVVVVEMAMMIKNALLECKTCSKILECIFLLGLPFKWGLTLRRLKDFVGMQDPPVDWLHDVSSSQH